MRALSRLPKAHLHVHLESTLRPATLRELAAANSVALPAGGRVFAGFRAFADYNSVVRECLRRAEDFRRAAVEFCADQAADGVGWVEVMFTAAAHGERLGDAEMPLAAVLDGLAAGSREYQIEVRVILDHSRRRSVARFAETLRLARRYADAGVIGIGLAGEETYPAEPFAAVCAAAGDAGVHVLHHAGEACGADSIRRALDPGRTERLGHGIRVLDDPELLAEVRDRAIPLEVCPSSNVSLGLVGSHAAHPLPALRAAGLLVTLNTDIPAVTGTTLTGEYQLVRETFGDTDADLAALAAAGVAASFAPPADRTRLTAGIEAWLADGGTVN